MQNGNKKRTPCKLPLEESNPGLEREPDPHQILPINQESGKMAEQSARRSEGRGLNRALHKLTRARDDGKPETSAHEEEGGRGTPSPARTPEPGLRAHLRSGEQAV